MKVITNFLKNIISFIDKKIVVPITKLVLKITSNFDKSGKKVENWLTKTNTLLFISLFLAIAIFIMIDQKILIYTDNNAVVLKNQPVKVNYNSEKYVVEGLPETVDITLIGSKTDLYIAKQSSSHDINIDLAGLKAGTHKVNISYNQNTGSIESMVNPSVATVIIYEKVSETRTMTVDIINKDKIDSKLSIENIKYDTDKVVIKGAEHQLKEVVSIKALVDLGHLPANTVGTYTLKDVPLKAYNANGEVVDVEIVPETIDVTLDVTSPSKEVPLKVIPTGEVASGFAISTMSLNETKVTIYGDTESLGQINYIPVSIDVANLKTNKNYKVELQKPVGIKALSVNNVTVSVTLGEVSNKKIDNVGIEYRNLADGYTVQGIDKTRVTVTLKGVDSVIKNITSEDVMAYIDLEGLTEGEQEVEVKVEGTDNKVQYVSMTKKIKIKIYKSDK